MRRTLKHLAWSSVLSLAGSLGLVADAGAQAPQAYYYYPSAGTYQTTAGPVVIPAPGYYFNVPAAYAPTVPDVGAWSLQPTPPRTPTYRPTPPVRYGYGSTPYYWGGGSGGTPHYLHGRGWASGGHR